MLPAYAVMWFYAEFVVAAGAKVDSSVPEEKRGRREGGRREGAERGRRRGREEEERCITLF